MTGPSKIEWTDATWNPTTGCTKVSPGCDNCYAERLYERFHGSGSFGTVTLHEGRLDAPLRWRRPRRIFVNSMSDLFHDAVPDAFVEQVFAVMAAAPRHTFQILTKRPGRMRSLLRAADLSDRVLAKGAMLAALDGSAAPSVWPLPNVWLGVSAEDQRWANIRVPVLLQTSAAVRWISAEPLLGPLNLRTGVYEMGRGASGTSLDGIGWVVAGGESGPRARPMDPAWPRFLRDQCAAAGVAFLFKQWGEHDATGRRVGKGAAGRELDGRIHDEYPTENLEAAR